MGMLLSSLFFTVTHLSIQGIHSVCDHAGIPCRMVRVLKTAVLASVFAALLPAQSDPHKMTKADVDRWMTELSNWGRWGKDDQLGTLNLITPAKRKQAVALVKEGYPISLSHDELTEKFADNPNPFIHTMIMPQAGA